MGGGGSPHSLVAEQNQTVCSKCQVAVTYTEQETKASRVGLETSLYRAIRSMPQERLGPGQVTVPRQEQRKARSTCRTRKGSHKGTEVNEVRQGDRPACGLPLIQRIPQALGIPVGSELRVSNACCLLHLYCAYTRLSHSVLKG